MAMSLEDQLVRRPVNREAVESHKAVILAEQRAYRLRELRLQVGLTQAEVAQRIGVGQRQVSKIENGDLDNVQVSTIRKYVEALGGVLDLEFVTGETRVKVA